MMSDARRMDLDPMRGTAQKTGKIFTAATSSATSHVIVL